MALKIFKRNKNKPKKTKETEPSSFDSTIAEPNDIKDPTENISQCPPVTGEGEEIQMDIIATSNQDKFLPSDVYDTGYKEKRPTSVPTAKESAFGGPPRYDWVDVETSAAIKLQSIFRRNRSIDNLYSSGKTTAYMRNRLRRKEAGFAGRLMAGEDVPTFMRFCGIGMLFGDATGEDNDVLNSQKEEGLKRLQKKEKEEQKKRKFRMRKKKEEQLEEAIEVVDNITLEGEVEEEDGEEVEEKNGGRRKGSRFFRKKK